MIQNKTVLVTVCARGGSKGIPGKNLKPLGGKPLLAWTLDIIKDIKYVDAWIFSSDSSEYCDYVVGYTQCPFTRWRPSALATDTISRVEAIKDAVLFQEQCVQKQYDIIVDVGVATPFKTASDIEGALAMFENTTYSRITTGFIGNHNPYFDMMMYSEIFRSYKTCMRMEKPPQCRQDAPPVFTLNDAVNVWSRASLFNGEESLGLYFMPPERSVHLDTLLDWAFAEFLLDKGYIKEVK